jgi:hypothetical protein
MDNSLMSNLSEDQQVKVFELMSMANIEDMNFAAQMLIQFEFDVAVFFYDFLILQIRKPLRN